MTDLVLRHADPAREIRILDVGCGRGEEILALAGVFPKARLAGLDLSKENIAAAEAARRSSPHSARISFRAGDLLEFREAPFDLILADSILQNVEGSTEALLARLDEILRPGGILIWTMPDDRIGNRLVWAGRRILRVLRGPLTDRLVLAAARRAFPVWDEALLQERIPYAYLVPRRCDDAALHDLVRRLHGWTSVARGAAMGHPAHVYQVYRKG